MHSFFYKNVVKPYLGFIADELGIVATKVVGHEDTIVSDFQFLIEWKKSTKQNYLVEHEKIVSALKAMIWTRGDDGKVVLKLMRRTPNQARVTNASLPVYKQMAWARGVIHHDDVMYFTYILFSRYPFLIKTLAAKFPYFYVDEFQDSNSLQVEIFRLLALEGAFVGIIGDLAQSIYSFNGASPVDFKNFAAPGIVEYVMLQNRRSSNEIIGVLNFVRKDLTQIQFRNYVGGRPELLVGEMKLAIANASAKCLGEEIVTLSRRNETVQLVKTGGIPPANPTNLFSQAITHDSNWPRREVLISCVKAVVLARGASFSSGLREITKALRHFCGPEVAEYRKVEILISLLENFHLYNIKSMADFADFFCRKYKIAMPKIIGGKPKIFYQSYTFSDFSACVKQSDDVGANRTVHKAKGDEFENVLFLCSKSDELSGLIKPNLLKTEEHRILYVGMSRARNRLFINVPELPEKSRLKLSKHFEIVDLV